MTYRKRKTGFTGQKNVKKILAYYTATDNYYLLTANNKFRLKSDANKTAAAAALFQFWHGDWILISDSNKMPQRVKNMELWN